MTLRLHSFAFTGLLLVVIGLSACGRKDDLYLPDEDDDREPERSAIVSQSSGA